MKTAEADAELSAPARSPDFQGPSVLWRYTVASLCVAVAFGIRYWLTPYLGEESPFMLFVAASLVAAWYGGATTGIVTLLLGLALAAFFFLPVKRVPPVTGSVEFMQSVRYCFTASLGILLIEVLHRDRRQARAAAHALRREVQRRERTEAALRKAEEELRQRARELEERVTDRTARLTETVQSLRDLLSHIAHNLRAPLRAMEGYSALLASRPNIDPAAREYLDHIAGAARRMDELIQDLLAYGRLGQMEVSLANISLQQVVARSLDQLEFEIRGKKAEITAAEPLPDVCAHAEVLEQVLTNLLENALKFVAPGVRPRVRVWAERSAPWVRVWVEDNGVGIDARYHERIFGVFETLCPQQPGTGIGLAIVKAGVQRLGGRVGVESEPVRGSRFWVELQAAPEP